MPAVVVLDRLGRQIHAVVLGEREQQLAIGGVRRRVDRPPGSGANRFTPYRSVVARTSAISAASASGVLYPPARKPADPAADAASTSAGVVGPPAIGAATTGS